MISLFGCYGSVLVNVHDLPLTKLIRIRILDRQRFSYEYLNLMNSSIAKKANYILIFYFGFTWFNRVIVLAVVDISLSPKMSNCTSKSGLDMMTPVAIYLQIFVPPSLHKAEGSLIMTLPLSRILALYTHSNKTSDDVLSVKQKNSSMSVRESCNFRPIKCFVFVIYAGGNKE